MQIFGQIICIFAKIVVTLYPKSVFFQQIIAIMRILLILLSVYFVQFTDKPATGTPALSARALEQRAKWDIAIDALDYPVSAAYLDSLRAHGATIHHTSRWMNGATCSMTDALAAEVAEWSFVSNVDMTRDDSQSGWFVKRRLMPAEQADSELPPPLLSDRQLAVYNLQPLFEAGYLGQGIVMTICDGGFQDAQSVSFLRHEQELGHFDFTDDATDFYGSTGTHGLYCLSSISGITNDYSGAAPEAQYYLMRSEEEETESPKEMDNLVAALEKADSLGTNVFSVSLGYSWFDNDEWSLDYHMLDGKTTRVSRAATIAARKGMLVCIAAGNDGNKPWHWISAPADADSVLTVGAVDTLGVIGSFSSFGPSADGRIKPEICAVGVRAALLATNGQVVYNNGTSYAAPLLAGLAATLWSALPDESAMQIRERIIRSANRYANPDTDQYGYGIPDAYAAYRNTTTLMESPVSTYVTKYIQGNTLYIFHNGKTYDVMGTPLH